jgi:hypothetical protein
MSYRLRDVEAIIAADGHSKLRQFVLGGATRSIIASPPTWVLLSH